jgi:hypothetical protein
VAASEPSLTGKQGPKLWDALQRQSPPLQGGGVRSRGTRGSIGALPTLPEILLWDAPYQK